MVWFLVDDVLPHHERVIRAGNAAMGLWVRAGAWCSGHLTDGFISAAAARSMGSASEVRRLVEVGLWAPTVKDGEDGYLFHAWAEDGTGQKRQPTKADVLEKRRKDREKKQRQRAEQKHDATGQFLPMSPGLSPGDTPGDSFGESHRSRPDQTIPPLLASLEGGAPPVDNLGTDPEPSLRCAAHTGHARPPRCGACKDARIEHEAWVERQDAAAAPPPRAPSWDPVTHCDHGQLRGACDACDYEQSRVGTLIRGPWGAA
jgi:hypothetical protein